MRTRSFNKYLEERLDKEEIAEIKAQAHLEVKILRALQSNISEALTDYMEKNNVGFNELVKLLNSSPSHVAKIQRGEANLTLASLAHIFALMGQEPVNLYKNKK